LFAALAREAKPRFAVGTVVNCNTWLRKSKYYARLYWIQPDFRSAANFTHILHSSHLFFTVAVYDESAIKNKSAQHTLREDVMKKITAITLAEYHGGSVRISSVENEGTTVVCLLENGAE
jgi:hypothetical protein